MIFNQLFWAPALVISAQNLADAINRLAFLEAFLLSWLVSFIVHELGHAVSARAAGLHVISATVGTGPAYLVARVGKTRVELRRYAFTGGLVRFVDIRDDQARWRKFLATAGGPLANILMAAVALSAAYLIGKADADEQFNVLVAIASGIGLSQLVIGLFNLNPFSRVRHGRPSDGRLLIGLLVARPKHDPFTDAVARAARYLRADRFEDAEQAIRMAAPLAPDHPYVLSMHLHCISRARGDRQAVQYYLENAELFVRAESTTDEELRQFLPLMHANVAWSALKAAGLSKSEVAEQFADKAYKAMSELPEVSGTFGAVLIAKGEIDQGRPMVLDAARAIGDLIDKADYLTVLARAETALENTSRADEFERLRHHILTTGEGSALP